MLRKLGLALIILMMSISGCAPKTPVNPETSSLKIGVLPIEDNLPFYVAEADGLFNQAGIQVSLVPFASAQERDTALSAGQIDGEVADLVAVALLKKGGTDVKVGSIGLGATPQEGRFAILAAPNSNIKSPKDLKGAQIAISENTIIEYVTDHLVGSTGLTPTEVKKISVPKIPVRVQMLAAGQIQAAVLPDPMATLAQQQGAILIMDDTKINLSQTVILFRQETITKKKEAVQKLIKVYGQGGEAITNQPTKYRELFIDKAKVPEPIKNTYQSPTFSKPQLPKEEDVNSVMTWMLEKKLLNSTYTYRDLVDSSLL